MIAGQAHAAAGVFAVHHGKIDTQPVLEGAQPLIDRPPSGAAHHIAKIKYSHGAQG